MSSFDMTFEYPLQFSNEYDIFGNTVLLELDDYTGIPPVEILLDVPQLPTPKFATGFTEIHAWRDAVEDTGLERNVGSFEVAPPSLHLQDPAATTSSAETSSVAGEITEEEYMAIYHQFVNKNELPSQVPSPMDQVSFNQKETTVNEVLPAIASPSDPEYFNIGRSMDVDFPITQDLEFFAPPDQRPVLDEHFAGPWDSPYLHEDHFPSSPSFGSPLQNLPSAPPSPMPVVDEAPIVASESSSTPLELSPSSSAEEHPMPTNDVDEFDDVSELSDLEDDEDVLPTDAVDAKNATSYEPPIASTSVRYVVTSPVDKDSDSESDQDSDYEPRKASSSRDRARRQTKKSKKAPRKKAPAKAPAPRASPSALPHVAVSEKATGKRRRADPTPQSKSAGEKRRKLADATGPVVNNAEAASTIAPDSNSEAEQKKRPDPPYELPTPRTLGCFSFFFNKNSIGRLVDLSEIPADKIPPLRRNPYSKQPAHLYKEKTAEEWTAMVATLQKRMMEKEVHRKVADDFRGRLNKKMEEPKTKGGAQKDTGKPMIYCPIPGCKTKAKMGKDLKKHFAAHTVNECFCPECGTPFGRFSSLTRHFNSEEEDSNGVIGKKCAEKWKEYQYGYHNVIFSLFYLGLYDTFDISDDFFVKKARRPRFPVPDAKNFKFASFPINWEGINFND